MITLRECRRTLSLNWSISQTRPNHQLQHSLNAICTLLSTSATGTSGRVAFTFNRMGEFKIKNNGSNIEELELELIDYGLEEIGEDREGNIIIRTAFNEFGHMSKALEEKRIEVVTAELTRIPTN